MNKKNFSLKRLYIKEGEIAPTKALVRYFLGLHLLYGILHFPLYLFGGYGTILPTVIFLLQHIVYPLTAVIGFIGVLCCFLSNFEQNKKNPLRFWMLILGGEAISSFLVALIERLDMEYHLYEWYVVAGNVLVDTIKDVLNVAILCGALHIVLMVIQSKTEKGKRLKAMAYAFGIGSALYLFSSEMVETIYFLMETWGMIYLKETLYILTIYAVYSGAGYACYRLTYEGAKRILSDRH